MIDTPTFDDIPEFAHDGTKVKPGTAKYTGGFVAGEMLPFDYHNWLMNGLTKNGVTEQAHITSINAELKSILTAHGVTPGSELVNQLAGVFARYVFGDNSRATVSITAANTPTKSGLYSLASPYTNGPTAAAYFILHIQQSESDNYAMQIASLATSNASYIRTKNNGTWTGWAKLWNADNDGAGSGLSADTVGGKEVTSGDFTPTLEANSGISSLTNIKSRYMRVGNTVFVDQTVTAVISSGGANFYTSIPVTRDDNFSSNNDAVGSACVIPTSAYPDKAGLVYAASGTKKMYVSLYDANQDSGARYIHIKYSYSLT